MDTKTPPAPGASAPAATKDANKSDFIRAHINLPVPELIAKGAEAGLKIEPTLIYKVRRRDADKAAAKGGTKAAPKAAKAAKPAKPAKAAAPKAAKDAKAPKPAKAAAPKAGRRSTAKEAPKAAPKAPAAVASNGGQSASDFVRSLPANLPAKEVVRQGLAQGLKFSANLVYAVRQAKRRKGGTAKPVAAAPKAAPKAVVAAAPVARGGSEATFRKLVLELGLGTARGLLDEVERKLEALVHGS